MADMDHDALRELAGLYALGALAGKDREAFEAHLASCAGCAAEVRTLAGVVDALPYAAPQIDPPPALRNRVLAGVGARSAAPAVSRAGSGVAKPPRIVNPAWLSAAALVLLTVALGSYALTLRQRIGGLALQLRDAVNRLDLSEQRVAAAVRAAETAQVRMAVLTAPDLLQVNLAGQPPAPQAAGRAFWSRSRGLLFAATELPPLPVGRTYQLWFLTATAPVSAGLVRPDDEGRVTEALDNPPDSPVPTGLAVSIEPEGGVPAPTGAIYLAGLTQ